MTSIRETLAELADAVSARGLNALTPTQRVAYQVGLLVFEAENGGVTGLRYNLSARKRAELFAPVHELGYDELTEWLREALAPKLKQERADELFTELLVLSPKVYQRLAELLDVPLVAPPSKGGTGKVSRRGVANRKRKR